MPIPTRTTSPPLVLIGGGGHALVVADAAVACGITIAGFLDDDDNAVLSARLGLPRLGGIRAMADMNVPGAFVVAVGDVSLREDILRTLDNDRTAGAIVHPSAMVASSVIVEHGVFVGPGAIVNAYAAVRTHAIINSGAIIEHEVTVGANSHVAPGAILAGRATVGRGVMIGLGAKILPGRRIGDGAVVGAGAVVTRDVEPRITVAGVPARPIAR